MTEGRRDWISDQALGRWLALAFVGMPVAFAVGVGIAKVLGTADRVPTAITCLTVVVVGGRLILFPRATNVGEDVSDQPGAEAAEPVVGEVGAAVRWTWILRWLGLFVAFLIVFGVVAAAVGVK